MAVDIGVEATDRTTYSSLGNTRINMAAAASIAGIDTSIDIWAEEDITGLKIGIFYTTGVNTLKCRSATTIAGTITAGSKVNKVVSLAVEVGDYIGCYFSEGRIERSSSGYAGIWQVSEDYCNVDDEVIYPTLEEDAVSLGGYIEVAVEPRNKSANLAAKMVAAGLL